MQPDFASQTAEECDRREWLRSQAADMRSKGATWFRATEENGLALLEGWKVRPQKEPPPQFFTTSQ